MKLVLTAEGSAEVDARVEGPLDEYMERAGLAVALEAADMGFGYGDRITVLAGPGNNGGDGYVAARLLALRGAAVQVRALAEPTSPEAQRAYRSARDAGVPIRPWADPYDCDLIIDALFGVGFRGELTIDIERWAVTDTPVLAVDIPTGLSADTGLAEGAVFRADRTVTFHAWKVGHLINDGPRECGRVRVVDIGLEGGRPAFWLCEENDAVPPQRAPAAHKWSVGSVIVAGGAPGTTGAAYLAAVSALHAGAGAVSIAAPGDSQAVYSSLAPELLTTSVGVGPRLMAEDADALLSVADRFDVLVLGPGLGTDSPELVSVVLSEWKKPIVLDADALTSLADLDWLAERPELTVLTPHAGEFTRLTGEPATHTAAHELSRSTGAVVVLKGPQTFVAGEELWLVNTGTPALATIGTGDVLAGSIGALLARGMAGEAAARTAAFWHGRAGAALDEDEVLTADRLALRIGGFLR